MKKHGSDAGCLQAYRTSFGYSEMLCSHCGVIARLCVFGDVFLNSMQGTICWLLKKCHLAVYRHIGSFLGKMSQFVLSMHCKKKQVFHSKQ